MVIDKMAVAGQMMKPGERIYRLADLSSVCAQAELGPFPQQCDLPHHAQAAAEPLDLLRQAADAADNDPLP